MILCINFLKVFRNFQPTKSTIKVGRSSECEVAIDDNMLSRVHCTIEYRNNVGWIIRDGTVLKNRDGSYDNKPSTNGTW
jgi:pSer/pThr/pTyr-binding forkhead associated (FHA) protein